MKLQSVLDTPVRIAAGRTLRELLLLAIVSYAAVRCFGYWPEFGTATGVALLFALRVPQARPIAVGFCLGWLISIASMMRSTQWELSNVRIVIPAVLLALLSSRDLFQRFDAAPARFIPNVWRQLPARHWRAMRWCAYGLGVLAALVVPGWLWWTTTAGVSQASPSWVMAGVVLALALLVVGSALGFVVAAAVSAFTLIEAAPALFEQGPRLLEFRPGMIGPICTAACVVLLLSTPYSLRLFRRS